MREKPLILVVDDSDDNREIVKARLEANGYDIALAVDGEDGLQKARSLLPDLILLDIMMPKLDGIEVVKRIKADADLPFTPVILLTAKSDTKDVVEGLRAGADDYLSKPVDQSALVARVSAMLRIKSLQDRVQQQATLLLQQKEELDLWNKTLEQRVSEQVEEIERMSRLKRFLAPQIAETIMASADGFSKLGSHRSDITVVFCDVRNFTTFSETSEPEELMKFLQEYHAAIGEVIFLHQGTLERFTGDSVMVFFNDPLPCEDHCTRGVQLALEMRSRGQELISKWNQRGARLGLGIGVAAGYATLGRVGFDKRFDYAAIGTVTNFASRICDAAGPGEILVSSRVAAEIGEAIETKSLGEHSLKGFAKPAELFEVIGLAS